MTKALRSIFAALLLTLAVPAVHAIEPVRGDSVAFLRTIGVLAADAPSDRGAIMTRGEGIKMLLEARAESRQQLDWYRTHLSRLPLFTDVSPSSPIAPYAEAAFASGITSGFDDRTLRPDADLPAEEAIVLILRAYREAVDMNGAEQNDWFAPYIRHALQRNIVPRPQDMSVGQAVTRGQLLDMIYRMEIVRRENLVAFADAGGAVVAGAMENLGQSDGVLVAQASQDASEVDRFRSDKDFSITIPSLGIENLTISHPDDTLSSLGLLGVLKQGVGHLFSYPGKGGKIMVYGHSSSYAWDVSEYSKIFTKVNKLKAGDKVYVTYRGNLFTYAVTGQEVISPNDRSDFSGDGEELILYTCWPVGTNKSRLIVKAVPVETIAMR